MPNFIKTEDLLTKLSVNPDTGLSGAEVSKRLEQYGENKLTEQKKKTNLSRFMDQFKDVMIIILIIAAVVSFVIAMSHVGTEDFLKELFEPALILLIVVINAIMGVIQESKAEKALEALKGLSALNARVVRDGKEEIIDASQLVPGDIIKLEAGDYVPADARLIRSSSLKSEESALTGESVPSEKDSKATPDENAPLGDRCNMIFSGCSITYGTAIAVVTGTGMKTEMGKIGALLAGEKDSQTPLQQKLFTLGKYLGIMALGACGIIFVVGLLEGMKLMDVFMVAISLAVSAIPEGLPAIVTIVLSIGVQRMVKKNAIIRRLPAVETLGSASIICSDKTGTLTQNRMTLTKAYVDATKSFEDISDNNKDDVKELLKYSTLCCNASIVAEGDDVKHIGDPTETALVFAAHKNRITKDALAETCPRMAEIPFDSDRKLMSTINKIDGKYIVIVKGAFDVMMSKCVNGDLNKARELTETMSSDALRVLAVAYKEIAEMPAEVTTEVLENDLTLMGLVGMIDPPRPEAKEAVAICRQAGIKPVMITGDHVVTASAIAKELGIFMDGDKAITGVELDAMSDEELDQEVENISVYARVSPENKIRIVKAWQEKGQVVSMTGDGVNDAPALKAADIGCAMGITGTDVAKGAADMTLTDDNFSTIVEAVREGRGIYANIKKVVGFLLGTNIGEVFTVFFAMVIWHETPLIPMQLLWINLVTDSLPAIALGTERVEDDVMNHKPKPKNEGIFANGLGVRVVLQGALFALLTLTAFWIGCNAAGLNLFNKPDMPKDVFQEVFKNAILTGETMAFIVLAMTQIVQAFNMRSERSLFKIGFFTNPNLNKAAIISTLLMVLVVFTPPVMTVFHLTALSLNLYLIALGLALVPFIVMEVFKKLKLVKE